MRRSTSVLLLAALLAGMTAASTLAMKDVSPLFGLGLLDTAAPIEQSGIGALGGVSFGSDINFYGVRGSFGLMPNLAVFADAGMVDIDGADTELAVQIGATYKVFTLADPLPIDLSVRVTGFKPFMENLSIWGGTAGVTLDADLDQYLTGLSAYGGVGLSGYTWEFSNGMTVDGTESDLWATAGAKCPVTESIDVYGEFGISDGGVLTVGTRLRF